ncbi:hypothetical protein DSO57_1010324 [Entomophthora muscae]|uniref:Uncharacterized protein n=1 Tax=Entomophthora muscae TaxID=34485 RepID=A0ACC2TI09_9FUNG|nr:hypothetical protein DSO57_1010324 [Entomophthora muscae]
MDYLSVESFPREIHDIDGKTVDVAKLAQDRLLILITLKVNPLDPWIVIDLQATWCQVCPPLLKTINLYGLNDSANVSSLVDPFNHLVLKPTEEELELFRLLLRLDAFFLVLSPGPVDEVRKIQSETKFGAFPFIVDKDLSLAGSIRLRLSATQIWPAILHIEPSLRLRPIHFGRAPGFYGISVLMSYLKGQREKIENQSLDVLQESALVLSRIKSLLKSSPPPTTETPLPMSMLLDIFDFLSPSSLAISAQVCRTFNYVSLLALRDLLLLWMKEVKQCCPRTLEGHIISHDQLNHLGPFSDKPDSILRKPYPISRLRDATNKLRQVITSYMLLGDKVLVSY